VDQVETLMPFEGNPEPLFMAWDVSVVLFRRAAPPVAAGASAGVRPAHRTFRHSFHATPIRRPRPFLNAFQAALEQLERRRTVQLVIEAASGR
jgi:hypothetical protein